METRCGGERRTKLFLILLLFVILAVLPVYAAFAEEVELLTGMLPSAYKIYGGQISYATDRNTSTFINLGATYDSYYVIYTLSVPTTITGYQIQASRSGKIVFMRDDQQVLFTTNFTGNVSKTPVLVYDVKYIKVATAMPSGGNWLYLYELYVWGLDSTPPTAPSNFQAVTVQSDNITLTWDANTEMDLSGYRIYRDGNIIADIDMDITTYIDNTVLPGITYTYHITAYDISNHESNMSAPVTVTTQPATPTNITATVSGKNIALTWQGSGYADYLIQRSTDGVNYIQIAEVTQASYTDTATLWLTKYYYRVIQKAQDGTLSEPSNTVTITTSPAAPTGLTAMAAGRNISLTWSGSAGAESYVIQRRTDGNNFSQIAEVTVTSYSDIVPDWNTVYYYRVLAKSESGILSGPSNTVQVKTAPAPPVNLRASVSYNNVTLSWDSSNGAASYIVQRSTDGDGTWLDIGSTSQRSYTDSGLGWNLTFNYRVLAKSADGLISEPSSSVSATTGNVPAPTGLTASLSGNDVTLNWQAAPYVTMYIIERSTDGLTWEFLVEVGNTTTYTDMDLDLSSDYYYRVRSDGLNQVSEPSNTVKVTVPPAAPTNLQATVDGKTVTLTWNGQDSMTFIIERSNDGSSWSQLAEVSNNTFEDTAPRWDSIFYYRVLAKNADGMLSDPSETVQAVIPPIPVPTGLRADVSDNTVALSWSGIEGVSKYRIERSQNGLLWSVLAEVSTTTYKDTGLDWQAKYYYRVRSVDGDMVSDPSDPVSIETPAPPAPAAPKLTYSVDNTTVKITWNYQSNANGYKVYVNGDLAADLTPDETSYSFTGERGKSYTVVVEAYNANGSSESSFTVNISEMPTPGAGTMAGDILKYGGAVVVSTGGLIALGLALKGSGWLMAIIKMFLWR